MDNHETDYKYSDFPVGQRAEVVAHVVDFRFFYGQKGIVFKNTGRYLGIALKFDEPMNYKDGSVLESFGFNPQHLRPLETTSESLQLRDDLQPCQHDKVYSPNVYLTDPVRYSWICRKCKAEGIERGKHIQWGEYDRLKREKEADGNG